MRDVTSLLIFVCFFLASAPCDAGGMFRRISEVGEWARYEVVGQSTYYLSDKEPVTESSAPGTIEIKCVGEETIDGVRHLWIEAVNSVPELEAPDSPTVVKYLVPEDEVMDDVATCNFNRGWFRQSGQDPEAFEREEPEFNPTWLNVIGMLPHVESPVAADDSRTITVAGKEIELTETESGMVYEFEEPAARVRFAGDCTIWTHADLAFGVAAAEMTWKATLNGELGNEMEATIILVATGTDAESDLPDHN